MSVLPSLPPAPRRSVDGRAPAFAAAGVLAVATSAALTYAGPRGAGLLAIAPLALVLSRRPSAQAGLILVAVAGTTALGRDFTHYGVGPLFVLEAVVITFVVVALAEVLGAAHEVPAVSSLLVGILVISAGQLAVGEMTTEALRNSTFGFYALWAFVGIVLARRGLEARFARVVFGGALAATAAFAIFVAAPGNPFTTSVTPLMIAAAESLYLGYALLFLLFCSGSWIAHPRLRLLLLGVAVLQLALIALGEVRSVWVALIGAIGVPLLIGSDAGVKRRVAAGLFVVAALGVTTVALSAAAADRLATEAKTIVSHQGATASDLNAKWRLESYGEATRKILNHPLTGIGFDEPEAIRYTPRGDRILSYIHNSYLGFTLRLGIPALLLLLAFEAAVLAAAVRYIRSQPSAHRPLMVWLLACQVLTAVHGLFTVVLSTPYMGIFFWLFGGLVIGLERRSRGTARVGGLV